MSDPDKWVVVGLDNGGTTNNATVLDSEDRFLVDRMVETPSYVREGPEKAIEALALSFEQVLELTGTPREIVRAVGLDTPGPVSADGVISSRGATNFGNPEWRGFDVRGALERALGIRVVYNNDANAAALYAHHVFFGAGGEADRSSSVSAIIGTGLGGGVIERGHVVQGAAGMAGELGHVWIPMDGLLGPGQPVPVCNCGLSGDAESVASLTGIEKNLLPYWLSRFPEHELSGISPKGTAAKPATSWRSRSSRSRPWPSGGCSRLPPISPTRTCTSSAAAWSRRRRSSVTGSWTGCASTRSCARSRNGPRASHWCQTSTWPGRGVPRSRPVPPSARAGALSARSGQ